jgi:hypothetical protein
VHSRVEGCEQDVGRVVDVDPGSDDLAQQQPQMEAVGLVGAAGRRLGGAGDERRGVPVEDREVATAERVQPLARRGAGTERRRAAQQLLLERDVVVVEQRVREAGSVAEAAVHRPHADGRGSGDVLHRDVGGAALGEQLLGGDEDPAPVGGSVRALGQRRLRQPDS